MSAWDSHAPTEPLDTIERPEDPRVRFAAERTLLAWIRTGLALMGFGFVVARFGLFLLELQVANGTDIHHSHGVSVATGIVLIVLGVGINILSAIEHRRFLGLLNQRKPYVAAKWSLGIIVAYVLAVLGIAMAIYLMVVGSFQMGKG
jgi:putative membrane protein